MELTINDKSIKHVRSVKYLGIMLDCHYVTMKILIQLYSIIYPFLIFGCTVWGMIYNTNIQPLFLLQKKIIRIMTFSKYDAHLILYSIN